MDDARLGDGMTLERIATELTAIRETLSTHDGKFESLEAKLSSHDRKFESLEAMLSSHDREFESLGSRVTALDSKIGAYDGKLDALVAKLSSHDGKLDALDGKVDSLDARMRIGFEETHRLIKMGFESVQILDEKVDRRFTETERQHADHKTLLEAAIRDMRRDLQPRSGPALRRRRRTRS